MEFDWDLISAKDYERIRALHEPLAQAVRRLIDASIHTGADEDTILRGTPLGPLRAEAWVERNQGHKTYARGFLADADGPAVEAEGVFIMPAWARDATG